MIVAGVPYKFVQGVLKIYGHGFAVQDKITHVGQNFQRAGKQRVQSYEKGYQAEIFATLEKNLHEFSTGSLILGMRKQWRRISVGT
jgi:hypothetical protein